MVSDVRGADVVALTLRQAGVDRIFTLSGNQIMPVFDATIDAELKLVHVRHEAAAVHMADAWARLTGKVGIALLTAGPGHANGVSALYTALASESPVVMLSGHAPIAQLGTGAFQEMRQADLAAPVTKASWMVSDISHVQGDVARAIRIALSGRPGPVHLSLPMDILEATIETDSVHIQEEPVFDPPRRTASAAIARSIAARLAGSERPLILAGPAMATMLGRKLCNDLEAMTGVPVVTMESPRGINDPSLGDFASALSQADCVVLLGKLADFTLRFTKPPILNQGCVIIQIDSDPNVYKRAAHSYSEFTTPVQLVTADVVPTVESMLREGASVNMAHGAWSKSVREKIDFRPIEWRDIESKDDGALHPVELCRAIQPILDGDPNAVLVADGGEFGQWAQACLKAPNRIINGPAGAIGSSLPFAIAARMAKDDAPIIAMLGDGTAGFHCAEFDTAVRYGLSFIAIIGNDACWNAEYQIQLRNYGSNRLVGCELLPTRYDRVAEALGGHGEYVTNALELPKALERAQQSGLPACVNVAIKRIPAPNIHLLTK